MATATLPCLPKIDKKSGSYITTWTARYPANHPTQPGKSFTDYHSFETKDLDRANERYVDFLVLRTKGKVEDAQGRRTLHWCIDYYLAAKAREGVTIPKKLMNIYDMWKRFFPADKMVHEINKVDQNDDEAEMDMDRWARLRKMDRQFPICPKTKKVLTHKKDGTPRLKLPIKPSTIRQEKKRLDTVINYCIKKGVLSNFGRPVIEIGKSPEGRKGHIDEEQFLTLAALLEKANCPQIEGREDKLPGIAIWAWVMFETACRPNEALDLKWDKVALFAKHEKDRIIDFTLDGVDPNCKVRNPHAPITKALLPILQRAYRERCSEYVCIKPTAFRKSFVHYVGLAGLPTTGAKKISPHSMRHSRLTLAVASGMSAPEISDLYSIDIATVMGTYFHGTAEQRSKNANRSSDQDALIRGSIKAVK